MNFREAHKLAIDNGCTEVAQEGLHHYYIHPNKQGKLTIPEHGGKDLKKKTENNIKKWLGVK
ncbi:MAG TPA: toxin HicA [Lachnospiraceae bacterium]|nr:toxin HicA [Lachnospiraceae bacterium]